MQTIIRQGSLAKAKEQFASIGVKWERLRCRTVEFLDEQVKLLNQNQFGILQDWISHTYRINKAEQDVCMRISNGEIDPNVAGMVSNSVLRSIPTKNVPRMDDFFTIFSPDEGGPVTKQFRDFSPAEIRCNVGNNGVRPINDCKRPIESRGYRSTMASSARVEKGSLIIFVAAEKLEVRMKITTRFKRELLGA